MDVLILLIFVGIVLVTLSLLFFTWTVRKGSLQHSDRLALLPLTEDAPPLAKPGTHVEQGGR